MNYEEAIYDTKMQLHNLILKDWLENDLFKARWWGLLLFVILFYVVFILLLDKKRTSRIMLFGCLMCIGSFTLELFLSQFVYETYLLRLIPLAPSLFIQTLTVIPLSHMLVFQYGHKWGKFLALDAIATAVWAFAFLPLLSALKAYQLNNNWSYLYSFSIVFIGACGARALTLWWINSEQRRKETT